MRISSQDFNPAAPEGLEIYSVPSGWGGTRATLGLMKREIQLGQFSPSLHRLVDGWTRGLGRSPSAEIARIYQRARRFITWRKGPVGMLQFLRGVDKIIARRAGNCADLAVFLSAAMQYLGHPTRLVVAAARGRGRDSMAHVWVEVWDRARRTWIAADPTFSRRLGAQIPRSRRGATHTVSWRRTEMQIDGLEGLGAGEAQAALAVGEKIIEATPWGGTYTVVKDLIAPKVRVRAIRRAVAGYPTPEELAEALVIFGQFEAGTIDRGTVRTKLVNLGWKGFPTLARGDEKMQAAIAKGLNRHIGYMKTRLPGALEAAMAGAKGEMVLPGGIVGKAAAAPGAAIAAAKEAAAAVPTWALAAAGVAAAGIVGALVLRKR